MFKNKRFKSIVIYSVSFSILSVLGAITLGLTPMSPESIIILSFMSSWVEEYK